MLWSKSCLILSACFEWTGEHPVVSNQTQKFNKMFNETMQCIVTNYNLNSTDICNTCMQSYLSLDEFYKTLSSDAIGVDVVCMDIVDSVSLYFNYLCSLNHAFGFLICYVICYRWMPPGQFGAKHLTAASFDGLQKLYFCAVLE